jgi:hypothetical protein
MTFTTDNRWSAGSSGADIPDDAIAAYAARWIDTGTNQADIVPDRQGAAYNDAYDKGRLFDALGRTQPHLLCDIDRDIPVRVVSTDDLEVWARRCGGYVYVDAWIPNDGLQTHPRNTIWEGYP